MPSCLCVCVCVCSVKNIEKCFKQGRKGVYRCHSQRKTIRIIILGRFCIRYKSRQFFTLLFQLLLIIGFMAPPLSKSHVVVTVSNATCTPICENTGGNDLATYEEAHRVSIPWMHSSYYNLFRCNLSCILHPMVSWNGTTSHGFMEWYYSAWFHGMVYTRV